MHDWEAQATSGVRLGTGEPACFSSALRRLGFQIRISGCESQTALTRRLVDGPPRRLDFNLLCNGKGIVDINAEISNCALDFGVAQ